MKNQFIKLVKSLTLCIGFAAFSLLCASQATAQSVTFSTAGCFGGGCVAQPVASTNGNNTAQLTFNHQELTTVNTGTPSGFTSADLGTLTVAGLGTFSSRPFTLQVNQTAPTAGSGNFGGSLSGTLIQKGSDVRIVFSNTRITIGTVTYQLVNLTNGNTLKLDPNATGGVTRITADITTTALTPTAAPVSISGRVADFLNRGVSNATVQITGQSGEILITKTNHLGYYFFKEVASGETYIFEVSSKRYQFNSQVVTVVEDLELNFVAQ